MSTNKAEWWAFVKAVIDCFGLDPDTPVGEVVDFIVENASLEFYAKVGAYQAEQYANGD